MTDCQDTTTNRSNALQTQVKLKYRYFSEQQNTSNQINCSKIRVQLEIKQVHKNLKVICFSLGNYFAGLARAWKANKCHFTCLFSQITPTQGPQVKLNINKIKCYTGKIGRKMEKDWKASIKLISSNFSLQKDTRICNQILNRVQWEKTTKSHATFTAFCALIPFLYSHLRVQQQFLHNCRTTYSLKKQQQLITTVPTKGYDEFY